MSKLEPGSYVRHAKLPELGNGEVIESERGTVRIRFASGERRFSIETAGDKLEVTDEAPPPPETKRAKTKKQSAAKR